MEKISTLKKLQQENIPFAVGIDYNLFKGLHNEHSRNYFYIIANRDKKHVSGFKVSEMDGVCERALSDKEVKEFKSKMSEFNMVINNKSGIIYEQKSLSFKDYFKRV